MAVPNIFANATASIPLSQLDTNFATTITLGNTAIQLGNTVTTLNNMTLANVTISSGTSNLAVTAITNGTSNVTIASSGGNISMATNGATAITVDTSQNVGIGITSPTKKLDVYVAGADSIIRTQTASASGLAQVEFRNTQAGCQIGMPANVNAMNFITGDNERMRITSGGNVLIGATSAYVSEKFNVTQSANEKASLLFNTNASFTNLVLNLRGSRNTSNSTWGFLQCSRDGVADVLYIQDSGNVQNVNNSYGAISDLKLKENIVDATPKLANLMQVKVRNYNLKSDPTHKQIGVIAQELEQVFPSMVDETPDRDIDGNDLGTTTKAVKYSVFVPMLIKAMQEQQALVTAQAETINALTARIVALESK
jgi:hypothetical protein